MSIIIHNLRKKSIFILPGNQKKKKKKKKQNRMVPSPDIATAYRDR